jgi:uncharacterized protein
MASHSPVIQDALYGPISLSSEIALLASAPVVQRLRHVRLSNIDSLDMPGIANLSRYEHVIGVAHLAQEVGLTSRLSAHERIVVQAAALLHDWAITAFGHLVEEALQYVGTGFDHEQRLDQIVSGETPEEIGGINRQIIGGRETGLRKWAWKVSGSRDEADSIISEIRDHILGKGKYGRLISGSIDLDNSDNLFRIAWHMGLQVDRETPLRLANAIMDVDAQSGDIVFSPSAASDIETWSATRENVYGHLMLAPKDFSAKLMILYSAVSAFEANEISTLDWGLNDHDFVEKLKRSSLEKVRETVTRWIVGDLWHTTPLVWMSGERPAYHEVRSFSERISEKLDRTCFAYAIKDKRNRALHIQFTGGHRRKFGETSDQWLLGVGSPKKRVFSAAETKRVLELATDFFESNPRSTASQSFLDDDQPCLL